MKSQNLAIGDYYEMTPTRNVIKVRNLRGNPHTPDACDEHKWSTLAQGVLSLLNAPPSNSSLEDLYRLAQDLHSQGHFWVLYNLQTILEEHLRTRLTVILQCETEFLIRFNHMWQEYRDQVKTIRNIFLCYDRSCKNFKYNTVQSVGLNFFTTLVILNPAIKRQLLDNILIVIENERNGDVVDVNLLRSLIDMFSTLHVYDLFEDELLKHTAQFYDQEATKLIEMYDIPQYLAHVSNRIKEERQRVGDYLNSTSEHVLLDILYKNLVELNSCKILSKGFDQLINKSMYPELSLMYRLFHNIADGPKQMITYMKTLVIRKGTNMVNNKNDKNIIQNLLDFKDVLDAITERSFDNESLFQDCIKSAFSHLVNAANNKVAQLLAKYLDAKLRCKNISDDQLETIFDKSLKLFKHVQGKDIFEAFYKKHLAKRLLLGKSTSQDAENSMISKLKQECGDSFTSNIEGMFQDINLSKTINNSFRERWRRNISCGGEFTVNVLTNGYWPNYPSYQVTLPSELVGYQQTFQAFYLSNHSGRKLQWQPTLSHCLVRGQFDSGVKELQVSLFQALVLLVYNSSDQATFKDIQSCTSLDRTELTRTILSLTTGKNRILIKQLKKKDLEDDDVFEFNNKFTDKLFRVKVNQLQLQQTPEEEEITERHVLIDRQYQIDAAIVRIMKSKKMLKHNALVKELYNVMDIPVSQTDLKKRIELLIEREYIERDKDNKSNYIYVA